MRNSTILIVLVALASFSSCGAKQEPTPTPASVEEPPPPVETPPVAETPPPREEPEPAPEPKTSTRYTGRTIVATQVERKQIRCKGSNEGASLQENRALCAQALEAQVTEADRLILVIDETPGAGCPSCVSMLAEVSTIYSDPPGRVLFAAETAGELECNGGDAKLTLEDTRKQCYETLQREGGSLRAGVVLPLAIEEGKPCKSCISIVATGYTAKILP